MSNVNIKRVVENIRANTSAYTPVVEAVVNGIQAIGNNGTPNGKVTIRAIRSDQLEMDGNVPTIVGFEVEDNGIGFTDEHRKSFDTLYSDLKIAEGGKGFGRFTCLKHFEDVHVVSVFTLNGDFRQRKFSMGKENDIIVGEVIADCSATASGTTVYGNIKLYIEVLSWDKVVRDAQMRNAIFFKKLGI